MEFCVKLLSLPLWERGLKSASVPAACGSCESLPLWERGLKFWMRTAEQKQSQVAPLVGAWIEIIQGVKAWFYDLSRSPCGSVD